LQDRHDILIKLEHLHTRIRNKKALEKDELCELLELFQMVVFDVYEEMERLKEPRCGLMQRAKCARGDFS